MLDMVAVRVLTTETETPIFVDQLYACRHGFQDYLNLVHIQLNDETVSDIIRILNTAVVRIKNIRISELTFRHVGKFTLQNFAEFILYANE